MSQRVVLFDLPSKPPCKTWSLNPWKTRLYLNYKDIPYETRWIEYPDLTPTLSPHLKANSPDNSFAPYTIPTVILPDGTYMQESLDIAKKLEEIFPKPALKIETPYLEKVQVHVSAIRDNSAPEFLYWVPRRILNEVSATWWYPDREGRLGGMKLEAFQKAKGGENVATAVASHVKALGEMLKENPDGPFFEGDEVTYADFVWLGYLLFFRRIGQDLFDLVIREERETHLKFLDACRPWMQRDDH